jgi:aerotaxis receptor
MKRTTIVPLDSAREFRADELFFSTTDRKGIIASFNRVFVRVAGHPAADLMGAPHNIIRHPDMPRAVFKLFWDHLLAGQPVAAYVKNMAADGRYYWVMALVAPIADGFLSIRFLPTSPLRAQVEGLYRELKAIEVASAGSGVDPMAGMVAAEARLDEVLPGLGFANYDVFMRHAVHQELRARRAALHREGRQVLPSLPFPKPDESADAREVRTFFQDGQEMHQRATAFESVLDASVKSIADLDTHASAILALCTDFRFGAINITVKSARLGAEGEVLGVLSAAMAGASAQVTEIISVLRQQVTAASDLLSRALFEMEWTGLQLEMVVAYYGELWEHLAHRAGNSTGADWKQQCKDLLGRQMAFGDASVATTQRLQSFGDALQQLAGNAETLRKAMLTIQMTHISGLIETQRVQDDGCAAIFATIRQQTDGIKHDLDVFSETLKALEVVAQQTPGMIKVYGEAVSLLQHVSTRLARMSPQDDFDASQLLSEAGTPELPFLAGAKADEDADEDALVAHGGFDPLR